jgi:hypothetical protein
LNLSQLDHYLIRRQVFKVLGAGFHVYDPSGSLVAYSRQRAWKLKEDIRVYADATMQQELLRIAARQVIDFSASYDVIDGATQSKVGAARRRGFRSVLRDSWELLDAGDQPIAQLQEDSTAMAMLRRFLGSLLIPQRFHLRAGGIEARLLQHFHPFVYRLEVFVPAGFPVDRRLVFATAVLVAAIEGRQG